MATPANRFRRVDGPDPSVVTVTLRPAEDGAIGEVLGPAPSAGKPGLRLGQDGSLTAHQAIAVGCHLANQTGAEVVILDDADLWRPDWGRLEPHGTT